MVRTKVITIADTATVITSADGSADGTEGSAAVFRNDSPTASIRIGGSTVAWSGSLRGIELKPGEAFDAVLSSGERLYGVCAPSTTVAVVLLEVGVPA